MTFLFGSPPLILTHFCSFSQTDEAPDVAVDQAPKVQELTAKREERKRRKKAEEKRVKACLRMRRCVGIDDFALTLLTFAVSPET